MEGKPHVLLFLVGSLLIYCGSINMYDSTISSAMAVTRIDELDKSGRAEIVAFTHIYTPVSNTIHVDLKLGPGNSAGTLFLAFQDNIIVDSYYFNKDLKSHPITVYQAPFQNNWVYIKYSSTAEGLFNDIVRVSLPAQENVVR